MVKISIVITLYNEEENIVPLLSCIDVALDGFDYEVVLVDDGSTDRTVKKHQRYCTSASQVAGPVP